LLPLHSGRLVESPQATFLYASLLRQLAHQTILDLLGISPGSKSLQPGSDAAAAEIAAAVTLLRQAAGVYDHLADTILPPLFNSLGRADRSAGQRDGLVEGAAVALHQQTITAA
jgi:hypothetical protein